MTKDEKAEIECVCGESAADYQAEPRHAEMQEDAGPSEVFPKRDRAKLKN